jgi:hypothetical protein
MEEIGDEAPPDMVEAGPAAEAAPSIAPELFDGDADFGADIEPQPPALVDTTAEMLGRATGKRSRTRAAAPAGHAATARPPRGGARKTGARKSAGSGSRRNRAKTPSAANGRHD